MNTRDFINKYNKNKVTNKPIDNIEIIENNNNINNNNNNSNKVFSQYLIPGGYLNINESSITDNQIPSEHEVLEITDNKEIKNKNILNNLIVNNQMTNNNINNNNNDRISNELNVLNSSLKSNSQLVLCPYCNHLGFTNIDKSFSVSNLFCCLSFGAAAWIAFQVLRKKDISFYNANHKCTKCQNVLNDYKAC